MILCSYGQLFPENSLIPIGKIEVFMNEDYEYAFYRIVRFCFSEIWLTTKYNTIDIIVILLGINTKYNGTK